MLEELDRALADAVFGAPDTEPLTLTVSPEVLAALNPQPADDTDLLIASVGMEFPVKVAGWSAPL